MATILQHQQLALLPDSPSLGTQANAMSIRYRIGTDPVPVRYRFGITRYSSGPVPALRWNSVTGHHHLLPIPADSPPSHGKPPFHGIRICDLIGFLTLQ